MTITSLNIPRNDTMAQRLEHTMISFMFTLFFHAYMVNYDIMFVYLPIYCSMHMFRA